MLMIHPSHLTKQTLAILEQDSTTNRFECLHTARYGQFGYIIDINKEDFETYNKFHQDMPGDLQAVVALAIDCGCEYACVSTRVKDNLFHLPTYIYEERPDEYGMLCHYEDCYCGGQRLRAVKVDKNGNQREFGPKVRSVKDYFDLKE